MNEKIEVLKTTELQDGVIKEALVNNNKIILVRIDDKYYAAEGVCPHMKGNLSFAELNGTVITCPLHGSQFDLKDGSVVRWIGITGLALKAAAAVHIPKPLKVYKVDIDGDKVIVEM